MIDAAPPRPIPRRVRKNHSGRTVIPINPASATLPGGESSSVRLRPSWVLTVTLPAPGESSSVTS